MKRRQVFYATTLVTLLVAAFVMQGCLEANPTDSNSAAFGAGGGGGNGMGLFARLGLTDDQIAEIKALHETHVQNLRDQRDP